jgi:uncharacterized protein YerC
MRSEFPLLKAFSVILSRQKPPGLFDYLEEVLTDKERLFVERRLRIARLLLEEKSYMEIQKELKVSAATVAQVAKQLEDRPAFAKLLTQLEKEVSRFQWFKQQK